MNEPSGFPTVELTPSQRDAIEHTGGPLLIIAGPGSGKTEVMTRRVAHLVENRGVPPEHILCITFTNRAADQLKERIQPLVSVNIDEMHVSTIHSFCHTLIERYVSNLTIRRTFRVLEENSQFLYVYNRRYHLGLNFPKSRKGDFLRGVISFFNLCSEQALDPDKIIESYRGSLDRAAQPETRAYYEELLGVAASYKKYVGYLVQDSVLDYAHLQTTAYRLLTDNPDILGEVREQYAYVHVDEFQDTNPIQAALVRLIADGHKNIAVVGDDDQSIYRFRGATLENMYKFLEWYPNARVVRLEENFRSTRKLVAFTSGFIQKLPSRFEKELGTRNENGNNVLHVHGETARDEAERVAEVIRELKERGHIDLWSDVALLLRSVSYHSEHYLEALAGRNIPFVVQGDRSLFKRQDIEDFRQLLLILSADSPLPHAMDRSVLDLDPATSELLCLQKERLSDGAAKRLSFPQGVPERDQNKIRALLDLRRRVRTETYDDVTSVYFQLVEISGYFERSLSANDEQALKNLGLFSAVIFDFDDIASRTTVDQFEWYLRWLGQNALDQAVPSRDDAVQIMTVHQAKGLEFPVVVLGSLLERRFPTGFKQPYYAIPGHLQTAKIADDEETHFNDERRLFYVGCTRAEKLLILGSADKVKARGKVSRFIQECEARVMMKVDRRLPKLDKFLVQHKPAGERIHLSYSHVMYYLFCPLRYKFFAEYDFRVPQIARVAYGASLHLALAELHRRVQAGESIHKKELDHIFEAAWIPMGRRARRYEEDLKKEGRKVFRQYYTNNHADLASIVEVEHPFALVQDRVVLRGRVDLMKRRKEGVEIVDFKTHELPDDDIVDPDLQLGIYGLAMESLHSLQVGKLTLHSLQSDRKASRPWGASIRDKSRKAVRRVIEGITARDFSATPGKHCARCEFRNICIYSGG